MIVSLTVAAFFDSVAYVMVSHASQCDVAVATVSAATG